jgi:hypothetical protein
VQTFVKQEAEFDFGDRSDDKLLWLRCQRLSPISKKIQTEAANVVKLIPSKNSF